jgi:uncharacterized pyridoxamine 5'-phosphate oxidase family protein
MAGLSEIQETLEENPVAFATVTPEGKPYTIGVAFVKVKNEKVVITDNYMKTTIDNLKKNKNVSLVVWDEEWNGYQINGVAEYFLSGDWLEFIKNIPENKDEPCKGAIVIEVKSIKEMG